MDLETLAIIKKKILTSDAALQIISKKNKKIEDNEAEIQKLTRSHDEKFNSLKTEFTNYKNASNSYMDKYLECKKKLEKLEPKYNALFKEHSKCELVNWNFKSRLGTKEQECANLQVSNTELTSNLEQAKLLNSNYEQEIEKLKLFEERNIQLEARLKVFTNLESDNTREILSGFSSAEALKAKALYEECSKFVERRMAKEDETIDEAYIYKILKEMQYCPELITPLRDKIQFYDCGVQTVAGPTTVSTSSQTLPKRICHKANQTMAPRRNQIDFGCQMGNQFDFGRQMGNPLEMSEVRAQRVTKDFGCQFGDEVLAVTNGVNIQSIRNDRTKPVDDNSSISLKQFGTEDCSSKNFSCQFSNEEESNKNVADNVCSICRKDAKSFEDFGCQFGSTNEPPTKQYQEIGCQYSSSDFTLDVVTEVISGHHKRYKEVGTQSIQISSQSCNVDKAHVETQTCNKISCIEVTRTSKPPTLKQALAVLKRANINITITRGKVVKYSRDPPPVVPKSIDKNLYKMIMKLNEIIRSREIMNPSYDSDVESSQRDDFHSTDSGYNLSDCETSSTRTQETNLSLYSNKDRMENLFGTDDDDDDEPTDFKSFSDESNAESEVARVFTEMRSISPLSVLQDTPTKRAATNSNTEVSPKRRKLQSSSLGAKRKLSQIANRFKNNKTTTQSVLFSEDAVEVPKKKRIAHNCATLKINPPITPIAKLDIIKENPLVIQPSEIEKDIRKFKKPVSFQKRLQNKTESFSLPCATPLVNNNLPKNKRTRIIAWAATNEVQSIQNSVISNKVETETANASSCIINETELKQAVTCIESKKVPNTAEVNEDCVNPETSILNISTELTDDESNSGILEDDIIDEEPIVAKKMPWTKAKKALRRLVFYQGNATKTESTVKIFSGQDQNVLMGYILMALRNDEMEAAKGESPFEPCLTMTQKVIIGLLENLEKDFPNITEDFTILCERQLLFIEEDPIHVMRITKFYAALCKMKMQKMRLRRTLCDAMYQMGDLAVPFIYHVLISWIQILVVVSDEQQLKDKPLIQVLIQLVHTKTCNKPEYFLSVLKNLLEVYYKYPKERYNENNLIKDFLRQFMCTLQEDFAFAIAILCKIKGNAWAFKQVELIKELINVAKHGSKEIVNALIKLIRKIQMQMCDDQKTYAKVDEILTIAEKEISVEEMEILDLEDVGA